MSGLKKYYRGEPIGEFPGASWNALVRGEERDRQAWPPNGRGPEGGDSGEPPSPVRVAVRNDSGGTVPTGGVLKLTGVVSEPATDIATLFDSLVFTGGTPAADERHVIIASEPIPDGAIGYGVIPAAAWAKLNITAAAHAFAKPKASTAELESDASTGFPVIWKESGTGSKWAVVSLQRTTPPYITIKGTTGAVSRSDPDFTLSEPVSVNGPVPDGTITVTNDPPINTPGGRTVYARYNVSIGTDDTDRWDTGDAGNVLLHLRGLADWVVDEDQVLDHDADGDPHWHGTGPCEPPA